MPTRAIPDRGLIRRRVRPVLGTWEPDPDGLFWSQWVAIDRLPRHLRRAFATIAVRERYTVRATEVAVSDTLRALGQPDGTPGASTCRGCGRPFRRRADALYCSGACRQRAYRQRLGVS